MSVYYRLYQNKLKNSKVYGKYFARAVHTDMVDLDDIAEIIERNCTLKRSDVKACLTELVEVMRDKMQSSNKVRINGLGIFKINVKSTGVDAPGEETILRSGEEPLGAGVLVTLPDFAHGRFLVTLRGARRATARR